jgi:hypothetical protein
MNGRVPAGGAVLGIAVGALVVAGFHPGAREPRPLPLPASGAGAHAPARPGLAVTTIASRASGSATTPAAGRTRATPHRRHTVRRKAKRDAARASHRVPADRRRAEAPTAPVQAVPTQPRPVTVAPPVTPSPAPAGPEPAPAKPTQKPARAPKPQPAPATTFDDSG